MKVKDIWFIPQCPGLPVYELMNGDLMMPFDTGKRKFFRKQPSFFWVTFRDIAKGCQDETKLRGMRKPFELAAAEIAKQKIHRV